VIRRVVNQLNAQLGGSGKLHHAFDELRPVTAHRRTTIEVNRQGVNIGIAGPLLLPPLNETIDDEVTGFRRLPEINRSLTGVDVKNTEGH
jgi:hypothetical protein